MSSPDTAPVKNAPVDPTPAVDDRADDRDWWTPREFADHAGLSLNYVRKRLHYGDIPFEKVPDAGLQNVRIPKTEGQAWIDRPPKDWGLTHQWVANKTGFSRSGVSRMRSNINTDAPVPKARMQKIEDAFGWTVRDQGIAWAEGRWVTEFERVITDAYNQENGS